jgi:hypothetical protein
MKNPDKMSEQELRAEVKQWRSLSDDIRTLYSYAKDWVCSDKGLQEDMAPFTRVRVWLEEVFGNGSH